MLEIRNAKKLQLIVAIVGGWLLLSSFALADISLPRIFSDHMVLQQKSAVKVWGSAEPGQEIEITFNEQSSLSTADADGNWNGVINTPAAGGPFELEIKATNAETKVVFTDVMVGEVWICSGQSNMEWPTSKALNPDGEIESSKKFPNIRLFSVGHNATPQPLDEFSKTEGWNIGNPESVADFSAVAYFFGRDLHENLDVPIGLIHTSWGGTRCEAWISRPGMDSIDELKPLLAHWDENDDPTNRHRPSNLFNGMIAPLKGFRFQGVIWYQGEANVGRGRQYHTLFPALIDNWRTELNNPDAPFLFVQLAPFRYGNQPIEALAEVWDAQRMTQRNVADTGMVVTTDIGNVGDIHPQNKQEVGRRLALWALGNTYQELLAANSIAVPETFSGPLFKTHEKTEGTNEIVISFDHIGEGFEARGGGELTHFTICGEDQEFVPAKAEIEGDTIVVSADGIQEPTAVRFAWDDSSEPNLFNKFGLPASPFRTDEFPLLSDEVDF